MDECWTRVFTTETQLWHIWNFAELAKVALVMCLSGSVENEKQFSLMKYTKNESQDEKFSPHSVAVFSSERIASHSPRCQSA